MNTDILIAGSGCSGLYCALNIPEDKAVLIVTKSDVESSDSFLAQGGMCTLTSDEDYDSFFEDTLAAGHYENDKESVEIMIKSSQDLVEDLISMGVDFQKDWYGNLVYTREGAHHSNRIVFHKDVTGKEITSRLLAEARKRSNITILEYTTLIDIIEKDNICYGAIVQNADGSLEKVAAQNVVLATGGVGGVYEHSTNFRHLTGDAIAIAVRHGVELKDTTYVQIHPTTLYQEDSDKRRFLISESMRGEGAKLYDKDNNRFVNELLPRDLLTSAIQDKMDRDQVDYVWEDFSDIPNEELLTHFPNIVKHCKKSGYDMLHERIPVVPAQHYFMGGIRVNHESKTSMNRLYAVGETACNGVHGKNRLASNSLLESLVFAKRAANDIVQRGEVPFDEAVISEVSLAPYHDLEAYRKKNLEIVKEKLGGK